MLLFNILTALRYKFKNCAHKYLLKLIVGLLKIDKEMLIKNVIFSNVILVNFVHSERQRGDMLLRVAYSTNSWLITKLSTLLP